MRNLPLSNLFSQRLESVGTTQYVPRSKLLYFNQTKRNPPSYSDMHTTQSKLPKLVFRLHHFLPAPLLSLLSILVLHRSNNNNTWPPPPPPPPPPVTQYHRKGLSILLRPTSFGNASIVPSYHNRRSVGSGGRPVVRRLRVLIPGQGVHQGRRQPQRRLTHILLRGARLLTRMGMGIWERSRKMLIELP